MFWSSKRCYINWQINTWHIYKQQSRVLLSGGWKTFYLFGHEFKQHINLFGFLLVKTMISHNCVNQEQVLVSCQVIVRYIAVWVKFPEGWKRTSERDWQLVLVHGAVITGMHESPWQLCTVIWPEDPYLKSTASFIWCWCTTDAIDLNNIKEWIFAFRTV